MTAAGPTHYIWWLVSRASGIVAVALVSISVLIGLAMAAKQVPPRRKRARRSPCTSSWPWSPWSRSRCTVAR